MLRKPMETLGSYVIDGRGMHNANNIDVKVSVDCCLQYLECTKLFFS